MYKNALYLTFKLTALAAVAAYDFSADTVSGYNAAAALAFCCLIMADFLINKMRGKTKLKFICPLAVTAGCFFLGAKWYFPLLLIQIFELIDLLETDKYFYFISASAALLSALIFAPSVDMLVVSMVLTAAGAFARVVVLKLEYYRELTEEQRKSISSQNGKISELKAYSKTLRETAALEERSRFSARIHDKLGHGISGSIILLEGAKLNMKSDPEQAEKSLDTAIENLRGSVDSIREALREERPKRHIAGIAEFKEMLESFAVSYEKKTDFSAEGDIQKITPQIWSCLKENLTEAMTNTVKHSGADKFSFHIRIYDKIIRAEFADNGSAQNSFTKGMGLEAIEERTAAAGGSCIFQNGSTGFRIINIFRL